MILTDVYKMPGVVLSGELAEKITIYSSELSGIFSM